MHKPSKIINTPSSIRKPLTAYTPATPTVFGPRIPSVKLDLENAEQCGIEIQRLLNALRSRRDKGRRFDKEISDKEHSFRKRLAEINQDAVLSKSEVNNLKMIIKKEKQKSHNLETKILGLEGANDSLLAKNEGLQGEINNLRYTLKEKDLKLNQNILQREKTKQKLALQAEKMNHELDMRLRRQREHMQAEMLARENKLRKVREVLDSEAVVSVPSAVEREVQTQTHEVNSDEEARPSQRRLISTPSKRHRRSRSVGEVWLEHNSIKPIPLGTVLQPQMKKRKSVTKLSKASDVTNPKQNKYCLIAQEEATDGEMETKLYKGDIVATCGGGAQVIFNDVERLRQESPTQTPSK